jgi:hypothetical protein
MIEDTVPDFPGQIQSAAVSLQNVYKTKALFIVTESKRRDAVERTLSCMSKRRMSQVVAKRNRFDQVFIETKRLGNRPCILGNLQSMGKPGPIMISRRRQKDLGLVFEPAEGLAVQDPVSVTLKSGPDITGHFRPYSAPALHRQTGPGRKNLLLSQFKFFPNRHKPP